MRGGLRRDRPAVRPGAQLAQWRTHTDSNRSRDLTSPAGDVSSLSVASPDPELEYELVNEALRRALASMESYPPAYETQGEEALRHVLLAALEGALAAGISGETLRGRGHTDIHVRVGDHVIYVGECKVWSGPAKLQRALDQLLGYGIWRDRGLGLIVFVRGQRFRATVARARRAIETHASFRVWLDDAGDPENPETPAWARFAQQADPDGQAVVAVHFAHLPTSRGQRIGGGVDDVEQGLDALIGLRAPLGDVGDDGIEYRGSVGTPLASPAPEPGSMMRVERITPEGRAAIDAVPLNDEALRRYGPAGSIELDQGDAGDRARMLIDEARRWRAQIEVSGGFRVRMDRYPPRMHPAVERVQEKDKLRIVLRPSTNGSWPVELRINTDRGDATIPMHLHAVEPPPEGWDVALRGHFHNVSFTYALTRPKPGKPQERELSWALHPTDASVRDRLAGLDFLYAMSGAGALRIESGLDELPSADIELANSPLDRETMFERAFFTDLVTLEDWTGRRFELPETASADQVQRIATVAAAIRTGRWQSAWERLTFSAPGEPPPTLIDWKATDFPLPLDADIFGEPVRFGFGRATIHFDIEAVEPSPADPGQHLLTIVPHGARSTVVDVDGLEPVEANGEDRRTRSPGDAPRA